MFVFRNANTVRDADIRQHDVCFLIKTHTNKIIFSYLKLFSCLYLNRNMFLQGKM